MRRFALVGLLMSLVGAVVGVVNAAEPWQGTVVVDITFAGAGASGERDAELDRFAGALEQRLATLRERLRAADGVTARVLRRDIGQLEGELEAIALDRGAAVTLGRRTYALSGSRLGVDADEGRLVIDRATDTGHLQRGPERITVKLAALPATEEPADTTDGPAAFGAATRQATLSVGGESTRVVWIPGWPNIYALERLDSQSRSPLHRVLATLPGLPIDVEAHHKGGRMRWHVVECRPGPVDPRLLGQ